jgi:hypothetical protein
MGCHYWAWQERFREADVHRLRMLVKRKVSADSIAKLLGRYVGSAATDVGEEFRLGTFEL